MIQRPFIACFIIGTISLSWAFVSSPWGRELIAYFRGEARFHGHCASNWRSELLHWDVVRYANVNGHVTRGRLRRVFPWVPWYSQASCDTDLVLLGGDPEATPVLLELLRDSDPSVRLIAAEGLARVNPPPVAAAPHLFDAAKDDDLEVRREAVDALFRIDWNAAYNAGLGWGRWWR